MLLLLSFSEPKSTGPKAGSKVSHIKTGELQPSKPFQALPLGTGNTYRSAVNKPNQKVQDEIPTKRTRIKSMKSVWLAARIRTFNLLAPM